MPVNACEKCGRVLRPGELSYQVRIDLVSTFDGYIEEPDEETEEELDRLIQAVAAQDPEEAAKDVAQTIQLTLCRACRNELVREYDLKSRRLH